MLSIILNSGSFDSAFHLRLGLYVGHYQAFSCWQFVLSIQLGLLGLFLECQDLASKDLSEDSRNLLQ